MARTKKPPRGSSKGIEWRTDAGGKLSYRFVYNGKHGKKNGAWCDSHAQATSERTAYVNGLNTGTVAKPSTMTVGDAWAEWLAGAKAGTIRKRSGEIFKPGTLRTYEAAWKKLEADFGALRLSDVRRPHIQKWTERYAQQPQERKNRKADDPPLYPSASSVKNSIDPLRAIYRRAVHMERVSVDPTRGLQLPKPSKRVERIVSPAEATELLAKLDDDNTRAVWAAAFYSGLRLGELMALRWSHVDLDKRVINVQRSWDDKAGEVPPKSKASNRKVPVIDLLADVLKTQKERTGRGGTDLVFGRSATVPFSKMGNYSRSRTAWKEVDDPPTLHDARHTFGTYMIFAGCNAKALSVVMGHEDITTTFNIYGHMMPGGEQEVGRLLGEYLAK